MDFLTATIALLLPVLLGGLWLGLFVPRGIVARRALVWGNGALIGLMLIPQIMRAQDAVGLPLNFSFTYSIVCTLVVLALIARVVITRNSQVEYTKPRAFAAMPTLHRVLFVIFLLMILSQRKHPRFLIKKTQGLMSHILI